MTTWLEFAETLREEFKGAKKSPERHGVADFLDWTEKSGLLFPPPDKSKALADYQETLEAYRNARTGKLSKKGEMALRMAQYLVEKAASVDVAEVEEVVEDTKAEEAKEKDMPRRVEEEEQDELMAEEEGMEAAEEEEAYEEEEVEAPPKKRRGPHTPRIVVQMPSQRRPPHSRAEPRGSQTLRSILPRTEKIRLYKRDDYGKRVLIEDYSVEDLAGKNLQQFLREYIDPRFGNDSGQTEYIAYEVDARTGRDKNPPSSIVIESEASEESSPHDAFGTVRKAVGLMQELQQVGQLGQQPQQRNEVLSAAQKRAVDTGDVNSLMMLMMMERMMGNNGAGQQNELFLKVLDRLDKVEKRNSGPTFEGGGGFGPPPGFGGFPPPPMYMPPPPPPPMQPVGANSIEKVVELAVAKLVQPPAPLSEQLKEMLTIKQLTGGESEMSALKSELAALRASMASGKPASGIEDSLANFEKFTTIVKSVAPQVTGGGDGGGFLKGLFTSEVGKVLGDVLAKATAAQQQPQQQAQQPQQPQQPAPPQPPQPPQGPPPPPQQVVDAVNAFRVAQTPEVQAQRFVDVMLAMYTSGQAHYRRILDPALESLNKAEESVKALDLPRRTAMSLIMEMRPPLATPDFVDKCLAAMAMRAGVTQLPDTLLKTAGKWTVDYAGNILLLEMLGAKPVEESAPSNGSHPETVQASAQKPLPLTDVVEPPQPQPSPPHIEVVEFPAKA